MDVSNKSLSAKDSAGSRNHKNMSERESLLLTYQDALNELRPSSRANIVTKLLKIFSKWQMDHGVYPPGPSGFIRALQDIGFSEKTNNPMRYKFYLAQNPSTETSSIKPWQCCEGVSTLSDLFDRLVTDKYPPLIEYLNRKTTPRLDRIWAVVIFLSLEEGMDINSSFFAQAGRKLVQVRIDETKYIVRREIKRESAVDRQRENKRELSKKAVLSAKEKLEKNAGGARVSNKAVAREVGLSESQVSRILKG